MDKVCQTRVHPTSCQCVYPHALHHPTHRSGSIPGQGATQPRWLAGTAKYRTNN